MSAQFVHLHLHTVYSIVDGMVRIKPLIDACKQSGMPAVAVTDVSNFFATVKFYRAAQAAGIKPIIGAEMWLYNEEQPKQPFSLVLLCQNKTGYQHLTEIIFSALWKIYQNS